MRSGALREALQVQRQVQIGVSALNAPLMQWQDWDDPIPCEVAVRRGREIFDETTRQRYSEDVWHFRMRLEEVEGLDPTMRIVFDDLNFDIKHIRPDVQFRQDCIIECTTQDMTLGAAALAIAITDEIVDGEAGEVYAGFSVTASGGTTPYTFAVVSGSLPTGLSLNGSTGAISGTPSAAGSFEVIIKVTDANLIVATLPEITITIA